MRLKKSIINSSTNIVSYIISFIPSFIVRKVFIITLGGSLLGLSSLYSNIIGYLSIVEMGMGSAIIYSLYKPFAENNREKIKGYLNFYEKFYKYVGIIILIVGLIITPFIHELINENIDINLVRISFILFLINTFITYMFTYKHCILNVAQEGYKISLAIMIGKILISIFQIIVLVFYKNFYLYIIVQIVINLLNYITINSYIDKKFTWIKHISGYIEKSEKDGLIRNVKALFYHKIGTILVLGTDNIVISKFINLKTVGIYNSYMLIIGACSSLISSIMNGLTPSIGNLLVEKDKDYSYEIHKKLFFITFWIASFTIISLFNTISQFISLWIGTEFILDSFTLILILFNLYFQMMRAPIGQFKSASGEYYRDRYAPICEGLINFVSSMILVQIIGLPGVFLGTLISNISIIFWVQPKIVYKYVFNKPLVKYFKMYFKYLLLGIIPLLVTMILTNNIKKYTDIKFFVLNCLINVLVINSFYLIVFRKNEEFNYFKNIVCGKIKVRNIKPNNFNETTIE